MGRGRRRIIQDIHTKEDPNGPGKGANREAEVEGAGKGTGPGGL